jgi:vacuolar iron transporter family protein
MASKEELKRYRSNLSNELHSAALYETLAKVQKDVFVSELVEERRCDM